MLSGRRPFSGKLATSWAYRFEDLPSNSTYSYLGGDKYNQEYNEGIYVGYRFFDTFDCKPRYRFGYGLSYTTFETHMTDLSASYGQISVKVSVKNTGEYCGKETAMLYASVPFGDDGAEAKRLAAFAKTSELKPGEEQRLDLIVPLRQLSCYDEGKAAWILRAGEYMLYLGDELCCVLTLNDEKVLEQCENICPPQHKIDEIRPAGRKETNAGNVPCHSIDGIVPETVQHRYDLHQL